MQVVSFAGDLLSSAEGLLRDGLHTSEVAEGYTKAATKVHLSRPTSSAFLSLLALLHMQISSALLSLLVSCILQTSFAFLSILDCLAASQESSQAVSTFSRCLALAISLL